MHFMDFFSKSPLWLWLFVVWIHSSSKQAVVILAERGALCSSSAGSGRCRRRSAGCCRRFMIRRRLSKVQIRTRLGFCTQEKELTCATQCQLWWRLHSAAGPMYR